MSMLKKRARDLQKRRPQDIDPEDETSRYQNDEESSEEDDAPTGGREHYETVEKSRMRKPEQPKFDKKYRGVAVSRAALEDDNEDPFAPVDDDDDEDPFATNGDVEGLSELDASEGEDVVEAESEDLSEAEDVSARHTVSQRRTANATSKPAVVEDSDDSDDLAEQSVSEEDDEDDSSDGSNSSVDDLEQPSRTSTLRQQMKTMQAGNAAESTVVLSLSSSAIDQARKGAAVQQQQDTFDRLLNSRIKLQKAWTGSNELDFADDVDADVKSAAKKAEAAAMSLWSTIDAIRCDILAQSQSSEPSTKKRKLEALEPSASTPLSTLHIHSNDLESAALPTRQTTLNHWYARTRPASAPTTRSALSTAPDETTISSVLTTYLNTNLSKLTTAAKPTSDTYDDTAFYQSLLTALIASRTNAASISSSLPSSALPTSKNPKVKKNVDTKASKGRKIRYTVHEKLQNFMAPEDRTTWTEEGRREFFGSLLGQVLANGEDHAEEEPEADEAGALRLFGGGGLAV